MKFMSGQFIYLPWFLSHRNKNLEQWTKRCRTSDKLQLSSAQADRSFTADTSKTWEQADPKGVVLLIPLGFPLFKLPVSSFWLSPVQNRACTHHQSMTRNANVLKANCNCKLYNSRLCCYALPYVFP